MLDLEARVAVLEAAISHTDVRDLLRDHEIRLRSLETTITKLTVYATLGAILGSSLVSGVVSILAAKAL